MINMKILKAIKKWWNNNFEIPRYAIVKWSENCYSIQRGGMPYSRALVDNIPSFEEAKKKAHELANENENLPAFVYRIF